MRDWLSVHLGPPECSWLPVVASDASRPIERHGFFCVAWSLGGVEEGTVSSSSPPPPTTADGEEIELMGFSEGNVWVPVRSAERFFVFLSDGCSALWLGIQKSDETL